MAVYGFGVASRKASAIAKSYGIEDASSISEEYIKRRIAEDNEKAYARKFSSLVKKQARQKAKEDFDSFTNKSIKFSSASVAKTARKEFDKFAKSVRTNRSTPLLSQRERPSQYIDDEPTNFFKHRDEVEVYGDEGLTFFDSQKPQRSNRRTGSLFGI